MIGKLKQKKKQQRKESDKILLTDYGCLSEEETIQTIAELEVRLKRVFKHHIGQENSITPYNLFVNVVGVSPTYLDIYKRNYWWNVIKMVLRSMRRENELFVINKGYFLFVLKSNEECKEYKAKVDRNIEHMTFAKKNADEWVRKKLWKKLK